MDGPQWPEEFLDHVREVLIPKMRACNVMLHLVPEGEMDAKFCVELGVSIMLDKPIIALVRPGTRCSKKLMQVADEILECDPLTDEGQAKLQETLQRLVKK